MLVDRPPAESAEVAREVVVVTTYPPGQVIRVLLLVLGFGIGAYVLWRIQEVVFVLFVAILLATAIEPIVNRLRRGPFSRGSGVLVVYTAIMLVIGAAAYLVVPTVLGQAGSFMQAAPDRLQALSDQVAGLEQPILRGPLLSLIGQAIALMQAPAQPGQADLVAVGAAAAQVAIGVMSVFVLAFYWLVERASIKRVLLRSVPTARARDVNTVWLEIEEKLGGWVRGQIILMLAIGVMAGLGYVLLGLPNPALLAVAAGLFEIVPLLGPVLAFTPAFLVALAVDPGKAAIVVVYALVIQQIESNVLVPRVLGETVGVSPLTVLLGILVGTALYGLPGAFVAVPIAGAVQVVLAHLLRSEDPSEAEAHPDPHERLEQQGALRGRTSNEARASVAGAH
ncbi:MAG TPA: AI-2E family transporter [Chloroflexota bacterium]